MRFFFCFIQLVIPEYLLHIVFNVFFLLAGEFTSFFLNAPLIAYHIHRWVHAKFDATIWCRRWSMDAVGLLINHVIRVYWLGTKIDRLWAARDCMIQQPSWMQVCVMSCDVYLYIRVESNVSFSRFFFFICLSSQTPWANVNAKAGSNWQFICSHSSIISTGKWIRSIGLYRQYDMFLNNHAMHIIWLCRLSNIYYYISIFPEWFHRWYRHKWRAMR